jgi:hypothetical protein
MLPSKYSGLPCKLRSLMNEDTLFENKTNIPSFHFVDEFQLENAS